MNHVDREADNGEIMLHSETMPPGPTIIRSHEKPQVKKGLFSDEVKQTEVQTGPGAAIKQGLSNAAESISNAFSGGSSATGATTGASTGSAAPASGSTSTYKETKTTASKF